MGNLRSVEKAFEFLGVPCRVQPNLVDATRLVIPGVGAFGAAMERIAPLKDEIRAFAEAGNPLLGICLGQQLLFERSDEMGQYEGLGLLRGSVRYLAKDAGLKVPHMGWAPLTYLRKDGIAAGATDGEQVYFVHSLVTHCDDPTDIAATAEYGVAFAAAVQRANVWGTQFHPEKSSSIGLRILRAFAQC